MRQHVRYSLVAACLLLAAGARSVDPRTEGVKSDGSAGSLPRPVGVSPASATESADARAAGLELTAPGPSYAGYELLKGGGFTLEIGAGTAFCDGSVTRYNGGGLEMAAKATNYIYLDTSAKCAPAASTKGFGPGGTPIARVFTGPSAITEIQTRPTKSPAIAPSVPGGGGINSLNGLTQNSQYFATGTSGSDFNISSSGNTHTFNLPDASATAHGLVNTGAQTFAGAKTFSTPIDPSSGGTGANNAATAGSYLRGNGADFVTSSVAAGGAGACGANQFVTAANDNAAPTCAQPGFSNLSGTAVASQLPAATATAQGALQLGGDLSGTAAAPVVDGLQGKPVASTAPAANQVLAWNGTSWTPSTPAGGAGTGSCAANQYVTAVNAGAPTCAQPGFSNVSGTAAPSQLPAATSTSQGAIQVGGDLSGTAAAPVVDGLQGRAVSSTAPTTNQVLTWNGSAWAPATPGTGGTVTSVGLAAPAEFSVSGSPVTTSGTLTFTKVNQNANAFYSGPSSGSAAAPAFRSIVPADLPSATATARGAIQLGGDLGGTAASPIVDGLQGRSVASTAPTTNQVLTWNGSAWAPATPSGGGTGWPSSWTTNSTTNAVTAQPINGQDAVPLTLAPNVASPTADLFDVYKDQGLTTKVLWIASNGNLNFMGNQLSLGTSGQSLSSYLQVYGGGGNQPYVQLQTSDGTKNAYLSLSNSQAGLLCAGSTVPGSDCVAGTIITTGTIIAVASVGGSAISAQMCYDYSVAVPGSTTGMAAAASPAGALAANWSNLSWSAYVSASGTVKVHVCNPTASSVTPTAMNFNVKAYN